MNLFYPVLNELMGNFDYIYNTAQKRAARGDLFGASSTVSNMHRKILHLHPNALEFYGGSVYKPLKGNIQDVKDAYSSGDLLSALRVLAYLKNEFYS